MSYELNKSLLENLKGVRRVVREYLSTGEETGGFDPELGICNAVILSPEFRSGCMKLLLDLMEEWPEFSGNRAYPVPHPSENPDKAFYLVFAEDMWGPGSAYGAARLRLLDWLIAQLETETRKGTQK